MDPGTHPSMAGFTIVAAATGPGRAARALIRISGPATGDLLTALLDPPPSTPASLLATRFRPGALAPTALPCLAVRFAAPRSFTGEDSAEFLLPGSPALVDRVLAALLRVPGVRMAEPGEFSARAFLSGKLSINQAEGISASIAAQSSAQLDAARRMLDGSTGARYREWTEEVATLLALVEAGIDFTDQDDVVPIPRQALLSRLAALRSALSSRIGLGAAWERAGEHARVVLFGAPNAGKSTLFNALLGRSRAATSHIAGTTRDALAEPLSLAADAPGSTDVLLIDLPGLDAAPATEIDRAVRDRALQELARADAIIYCDPAGRFDQPPPRQTSAPTLHVRTKADVPAASHPRGLEVCALDGWNLPTLRRAIADLAHAAPPDDAEAALLPRHRRALFAAVDGLDAASAAASDHRAPPELIAAGLRSALDALGEIAGAVSPDDVLGRVFAVFCIGK